MAAAYLSGLECSLTGTMFSGDRQRGLSPSGLPLLCRSDLPRIAHAVSRDDVAVRAVGMWRWRELLSLPHEVVPTSLGEGHTPLVEAARLAAHMGVQRLWIKDESQESTDSFKARGMSAAVSMAKYFGSRVLIVPSAGNAKVALAAYTARAHILAHVFGPRDTPLINRLEVDLYGGELHLIDGLINDYGREVSCVNESLGAFDVATLKEPYRLEGKKTMGYEICQQLGWRVPNVVVCQGSADLIASWLGRSDRPGGGRKTAVPPYRGSGPQLG